MIAATAKRRRGTRSQRAFRFFTSGSRGQGVAGAAGDIRALVFGAGESGAVRISAWSPDAVTSDTQLFARTTVTRSARDGIHSRRETVIASPFAGKDPSRRMGISTATGRSALPRVTFLARVFRVAACAKARLRFGFERMTRHKSRAVKAWPIGAIESKPRRKPRSRHSVTRCA